MWLDLRNGLPFPSSSVHGIYSCHFLEHLYTDQLQTILRECRRVLHPRGGARFLVPSLDEAIAAFQRNDPRWFPDFPARYGSVGGRFVNYMLCDGQHRLMFDFSFMEELLHMAGFQTAEPGQLGKSQVLPWELLARVEDSRAGHVATSLIVEAYP